MTVVLRITDDLTVVDANGQPVISGREHAKIKFMWRNKAVARAGLFLVDPHRRLPMHPFEKKRESPVRPRHGDLEVTLIPRGAEVVTLGLGEKRHLNVARLREVLA